MAGRWVAGAQRGWGGALLIALALAGLAPRGAAAAVHLEPQSAAALPAIEAGREADTLALVAPYAVDGAVASGWRLTGVAIRPDGVRFALTGPAGVAAALELSHRSAEGPPPDARSSSFALRTTGGGAPGADAALAALIAAVQANDDGTFWRTKALPDTPLGAVRRLPWFVSGPGRWALDGLVLSALALLALLVSLGRQLRATPPRYGWGLVVVFAVGAVLRIAVPLDTSLEPWPYVRTPVLAGAVFHGPVLAELSAELGRRIPLLDVIRATVLVASLLVPLTAFGAARAFRLGGRVALCAAGVAAVLPLLLRFALSDVEIAISVFLAGLAFQVLGTALHDRSRAWRAVALALLPLATAGALATRPEDICHAPLLALTALALPASRVRFWVRALAGGFVLAVAGAMLVLDVLPLHGGTLGGGGVGGHLADVVRAIVSPRYDTLLMPWQTPPGVLVLAAVGLVLLVTRRRIGAAVILVAWVVGFLAAHALVMTEVTVAMARYHLHLALPLCLLAGTGLALVLRRLPLVGWGFVAYLAAAPLVHYGFVRETFDEQLEFDFVASVVRAVPPGRTVLEYTGPPGLEFGSRFRRFGLALEDGRLAERWDVRPVTAAAEGRDELTPETRRLLADPPPDTFLFLGLTCRLGVDPQGDAWIAPACAELLRTACVTPVARVTFDVVAQDPHYDRKRPYPPGAPAAALYRLRPAAECAGGD